MGSSEQFGPMVAAEARKRDFENAAPREFVGDGSAWIGQLPREQFPTLEAVVEFVPVLGHVFAAATAAATGAEERWGLFQTWAEACWKGPVSQVIESLRALRDGLGPVREEDVEGVVDDDPRPILVPELGSRERNQRRMDSPSHRRQGLPWTSSHIASTVQIFNRRVNGSEKFWGETGAEAILPLRGASLSEDDRLGQHLKTRPCSPFRTSKTREDGEAAWALKKRTASYTHAKTRTLRSDIVARTRSERDGHGVHRGGIGLRHKGRP